MDIERLDGVPPHDAAPGMVWYHATVRVRRKARDGEEYDAPSGFAFQSRPDAPEAELRAGAAARWQEVQPAKG